jgi:anti-sigma factor (TIGR02949 family)
MDGVITCGAAVERLWAYLDHELGDPDHQAVEAHLAFCRRCCGEMEFAKHLRRRLATKDTGGLPTEVRARLNRFIDELGGTNGEGARRE